MDRFELETPVIVVTQFAAFGRASSLVTLKDLDQELVKEHRSIYKGSIYYNSAIQKWMDDLKTLLTRVLGVGDNA